MAISGLARTKCYVLLEGLEHSLCENLTRNFEITEPGFFTEDEQQKALGRMHEDIGGGDVIHRRRRTRGNSPIP